MPRDLSELMESAVSSAPAEKHHAGDITRAAERVQRRRTRGVAGAVVLAVVVVAGAVGFGATRHHATSPEPVGPWKYGQHHTLSDAVASDSAPWFETYDYPAPSVLPGRGDHAPIPQYLDVDAEGRLAATRVTRTGADQTHITATYQVVDGPKGPVHQVAAPPTDGGGVWEVSYTGHDQLMWGSPYGFVITTWITDLVGDHALVIDRKMDDVPGGKTVGGHPVVATWYEDGRMWFTAVTKDNFPGSLQWVSLYSFDPAHPAVLRAEKPHNALAIDVEGGEAVWLDGSAVHAEELATGNERTVPVPMDSGCHIPSADQFAGVGVPAYLSTDGNLVSVVEQCQRSWRLVVTDLAGRVVADVDSGTDDYVVRPTLTGDLVVFGGGGYVKGAGPTRSYALDLRSGRFVVLGGPQRNGLNRVVTGAGRYVLWYDRSGGHVGKLSG